MSHNFDRKTDALLSMPVPDMSLWQTFNTVFTKEQIATRLGKTVGWDLVRVNE